MVVIAVENAVEIELREAIGRGELERREEVEVIAGQVRMLEKSIDRIEVQADLPDIRGEIRALRIVPADAGFVTLRLSTVENARARVMRIARENFEVRPIVFGDVHPVDDVVEARLVDLAALKIDRRPL